MLMRRRLLVSLSASLLLVLAQLMVVDHVHAHDESPGICAYCISSDNVDAIVAEAQRSIPFGVASTVQSTVLVTRSVEAKHSYASRAPPAISS